MAEAGIFVVAEVTLEVVAETLAEAEVVLLHEGFQADAADNAFARKSAQSATKTFRF